MYIYKITKFFITNAKNSSKKEHRVRELEKRYAKLRLKSLVTGISTYQVIFEWD